MARGLRSLGFVSVMAADATVRAVAAVSFRLATLTNGTGARKDVGPLALSSRLPGRGAVTEAAIADEESDQGADPGSRRPNQPSSAAGPPTAVSDGAATNG